MQIRILYYCYCYYYYHYSNFNPFQGFQVLHNLRQIAPGRKNVMKNLQFLFLLPSLPTLCILHPRDISKSDSCFFSSIEQLLIKQLL